MTEPEFINAITQLGLIKKSSSVVTGCSYILGDLIQLFVYSERSISLYLKDQIPSHETSTDQAYEKIKEFLRPLQDQLQSHVSDAIGIVQI